MSGSMGKRCSDWLCIPLCDSCHRDNHNGVHGSGAMWKVMKMNESDALAKTIEKLIG
jgi:hypothetical protein